MKNIWKRVLKYIESYFRALSPNIFAMHLYYGIIILLIPALFLLDKVSLLHTYYGLFISLFIVASFPFSFYIVYSNPINNGFINYLNLKSKHDKKIKNLESEFSFSNKSPHTSLRFIKIIGAFLISVGLFIWLFEIISLTENNKLEINSIAETLSKSTDNSLIQLKTLLITAPIAFFIWAFRDHNKLIELENVRKDTNLKEFQQLQQWATGNIDGNVSDEKKTSLQISALHSLRPYLRGEYGQSFRRGAYEIFRSTLETQHKEIFRRVEGAEEPDVMTAIANDQLTKQLNIIASEEWFNLLINHDFPLGDISLVGVDLSGTKDNPKYLQHQHFGESLNLKGAKLAFANLSYVNLSGADLRGIKAQGIDLSNSDLSNSDLSPIPETHANKVSAMLKNKQ